MNIHLDLTAHEAIGYLLALDKSCPVGTEGLKARLRAAVGHDPWYQYLRPAPPVARLMRFGYAGRGAWHVGDPRRPRCRRWPRALPGRVEALHVALLNPGKPVEVRGVDARTLRKSLQRIAASLDPELSDKRVLCFKTTERGATITYMPTGRVVWRLGSFIRSPASGTA